MAAEVVKPSVVEAPCDPGQDNRDSDLCAQWKAADAARDAALWAMLGTLVAIIGTYGLYRQIGLTRKAIAEADKALEVTRLSAERQLRAYVTIDKIRAVGLEVGEEPQVWIVLKNRGQTPARRIQVKSATVRCTLADPEKAPIKDMANRPLYDLGPDQKTAQCIPLTDEPLTGDQLASILTGNCSFVVAGYVRYKDVFGKTRRTIFRGHLVKESLVAGDGHLTMGAKHTRST